LFTKLEFPIESKEGAEAKLLCNKQMMVINNAYKVLKDSASRSSYDKKRLLKNNSTKSYTSAPKSADNSQSEGTFKTKNAETRKKESNWESFRDIVDSIDGSNNWNTRTVEETGIQRRLNIFCRRSRCFDFDIRVELQLTDVLGRTYDPTRSSVFDNLRLYKEEMYSCIYSILFASVMAY